MTSALTETRWDFGAMDSTKSINSQFGISTPLYYIDPSFEILDVSIENTTDITISRKDAPFLLVDENNMLINQSYETRIDQFSIKKFYLNNWDEVNLHKAVKIAHKQFRSLNIPINNNNLSVFIRNNFLIYTHEKEIPIIIPRNTLYCAVPDHFSPLNEREFADEYFVLVKETHKIKQMIMIIKTEILLGYGIDNPITSTNISTLPINPKLAHMKIESSRFRNSKCYTSVFQALFSDNIDLKCLIGGMKLIQFDSNIFESKEPTIPQRIAYLSVLDKILFFLVRCLDRLSSMMPDLLDKKLILGGKLTEPVKRHFSLGFDESEFLISGDVRQHLKYKYVQGYFMCVKLSIPSYLSAFSKFYKSCQSTVIICQSAKYKKSGDRLLWNMFAEPETKGGCTNFEAIDTDLHNYRAIEHAKFREK